MNSKIEKKEFCSTTKAAQILGVSVGTVQQLVESGKLKAWKTSGGHRRIFLESVKTLAKVGNIAQVGSTLINKSVLSVYVVEDDSILLKAYNKLLQNTQLSLDVQLFDNGLDAMLKIGAEFPDLLILDLEVPFIDGFEMLNRLQKLTANKTKHILVITGLDDSEIQKREFSFNNMTLLKKPVNPNFIEGYIRAIYISKNEHE